MGTDLKKVYIVLSMTGKSHKQILEERTTIQHSLENRGYFILQPSPGEALEGATHEDVSILGQTLEVLSFADIAYFADGWSDDKTCLLIHHVAKDFSIPTLYEVAF